MEFQTDRSGSQPFRYASVGGGAPVVLLHGFPDGPRSWAAAAEVVAGAGFRAIVPFLRGYHPDTIVAGRPYGRTEIGGDVIALLDTLGVDDAVLVGHDWGSSSVWSAAALSPERVRGLVPIAVPHPATLAPSPQLMWAVRHFGYFKLPFSDQRTSRNNFAYISTLFDRWAPKWADRKATLAYARELFSDPVVLHEALEWYRDLNLKPDPANNFRVSCPGLVVAGADDFGGDLTAYEKSVERFDGDADLCVIDGAGHWPHREGADQFHQALTGLLGSLPA